MVEFNIALVWFAFATAASSKSVAATPKPSGKPSWDTMTRQLLHYSKDFAQRHRTHKLKNLKTNHRFLQSDNEEQLMCDAALTQCMGVTNCLECFADLSAGDINWASLPKDVDCDASIQYLSNAGMCKALSSDTEAKSSFCISFDACVKPKRIAPDNTTKIDCSALTTCSFEGMHEQFLGDGICHENMPGCYNTEICGWDNGDCCLDTCVSNSDGADKCGVDGFACRDPYSASCDQSLSNDCGKHEDWEPSSDDGWDENNLDDFFINDLCDNDQTQYRLVLYDSFGDGWEETSLKLTDGAANIIFEGALDSGFTGTKRICLSSQPACYNVTVKGGIWGKEVSWEVKPVSDGAPAIASGGSYMSCSFPAAGVTCENTCTGRTDVDPTTDPDYKGFKTMFNCIQEKCIIQMNTCTAEQSCKTCLDAGDAVPGFCFGIDAYNSVIDCTLCSCTDDSKSDFCTNGDTANNGDHKYDSEFCTAVQTIEGGSAIMEFSNCTRFDEVAMLMLEFDNNHFGALDTFEACAHAYAKEDTRGGRTAQSCMKILTDAINGTTQANGDDVLDEAISALSGLLYNDGESFCDCASHANNATPLCASFVNFKTLLYESVDACNALDEIDCDAWKEFYVPCRDSLIRQYTNIDFTQPSQCEFVHNGCGGEAGPFPSFRRLDCKVNDEVSTEEWSFYQSFAAGCLKDDGTGPNPPPIPQPVPQPTIPPAQPQPQPQPAPPPSPFTPTDGSSPGRKPYVPPEQRDKDPSSWVEPQPEPQPEQPQPEKKKSNFLRNFFWLAVFGGAGYLYYKRYGFSLEGFEVVYNFCARFFPRRNRYYDSGGDAMYSGLAMESSTTFEPASLPPPPSAVDGNYYI